MPSKLINKISRDLKAKYVAKGWERDWESEREILLELAAEILEKPTQKRFTYQSARGVGATGVVLHVYDTVMTVDRAMKLPRPRPDKAEAIREAFAGEIQKLLALNHQNIVKIYDRGEASTRLVTYPFFLMEFIKDGDDLLDALRKDIIPDPSTLLDSLRQIVAGLHFLHSHGIVHFDIKPGNVLVSPETRQAMITDLGFSQDLSKIQPGSELTVRFTTHYAHPSLKDQERPDSSQSSSDSQAARAAIKFEGAEDAAKCQAYDRFALGQTIFEILDHHDCRAIQDLTRYQRSYLRLIAARLLDGHNPEDRLWGRMSRSTLGELSYENTAELKADSERLTGEYSPGDDIPELNPYIPDVIQIPTIYKVPSTDRVNRIIEHPTFRRLAQISQLGLLTHVYPSACHTRFEHALGTFATTCEYIRALYSDEGNPLFRSIMRKADLETVLVASLLHDIGQYPLAHDLEDIRRHVFGHDAFSVDILDGTITPTAPGPSLWDTIVAHEIPHGNGWRIDRQALRRLLDPSPSAPLSFREKIAKGLISGPLDADKLDYVYRDTVHLGIPFGNSVDCPRLMKCLTLALSGDGASPILGVLDKGRVLGDAVGFARYALFSAAYWHHTARAIKAMIHHIAMLALAQAPDIRDFRAEFAAFVFDCSRLAQLELPVDAPHTPRFIFDSQVRPEDIGVLQWLARKSGSAAASNLVDDLTQRHLYKRLLEFSSEDQIWDQVSETRVAGFEALEECRSKFESALARSLPNRLRQTVHERARGRPLVLIDFPWRPGEQSPSSLVVRRAHDGLEEIVEASELLRLLYDNEFFSKRVSRLRVFVNPYIRDDLYPRRQHIDRLFRSVVEEERRRRQ